jgi:hypothetical protein
MPMTSEAKDAQYGPIVAIVNSASEISKRYEVRRKSDGTFSCQCMGYRFNKDTPRQCRHTVAAANGGPLPLPLPMSRTPQVSAVRVEAQRVSSSPSSRPSARQPRVTRTE